MCTLPCNIKTRGGQAMPYTLFQESFTPEGMNHLKSAIMLALHEDGPDLTAQGIFDLEHTIQATIWSKQDSLVTALPMIPIIFQVHEQLGGNNCSWQALVLEGSFVSNETAIANIEGQAIDILKLERVILNFITHLSGISNLTQSYVQALDGTGVKLLDTRKTIPGLRWPEKYAVRVGGGHNHRRNLTEMLMLKDNHIDAAGSIIEAVQALRKTYNPCPPIEVECRTLQNVLDAVKAKVNRIMLDNMDISTLKMCLPHIPQNQEAEISGNVNLENIRALALADNVSRRADFISVGRLTHSAKAADFSLRLKHS